MRCYLKAMSTYLSRGRLSGFPPRLPLSRAATIKQPSPELAPQQRESHHLCCSHQLFNFYVILFGVCNSAYKEPALLANLPSAVCQ